MHQEDGEHHRALFPEPCISQQGCPKLQWLALLLSALHSILEALKLQAPSGEDVEHCKALFAQPGAETLLC